MGQSELPPAVNKSQDVASCLAVKRLHTLIGDLISWQLRDFNNFYNCSFSLTHWLRNALRCRRKGGKKDCCIFWKSDGSNIYIQKITVLYIINININIIESSEISNIKFNDNVPKHISDVVLGWPSDFGKASPKSRHQQLSRLRLRQNSARSLLMTSDKGNQILAVLDVYFWPIRLCYISRGNAKNVEKMKKYTAQSYRL